MGRSRYQSAPVTTHGSNATWPMVARHRVVFVHTCPAIGDVYDGVGADPGSIHQWPGVAATSASDVWAVGLSGARALILHFNGTAWRRVASPALGGARAVLADVTAVSPHNVWAVGVAGAKTLIEHWNGAAWKRVPSPSPQKGAILTGVSAASAGNAWAVGSTAGKTLTLHWNGATWRRVPSPSPGT